jgi:anti-sigma B factor antagonist
MPVPQEWSHDGPELLVVDVDQPIPAVRVLGLRGTVNTLTAPDLEQIIDGQIAAAPRALVVDMGEVGVLVPEGVFTLVCGAYRASMDGIGFCLADVSRPVAAMLRACGLLDAVDLHDTVEDALITYGC